MSARKSLLIVVQNGLGAVLGAVALYFLGQSLGPGPLGMVAFAIGLANLATVLSKLGLDQAHVKRVSEGGTLADRVGTYLPMKLALAAGSVLLLVVAAWAWSRWRGFYDATTLAVVALIALYTLIGQVRGALGTTFQALQRTAKAQLLQFVETAARVPAAIVVAVAYGASRGRNNLFGGLPGWFADTFGRPDWDRFDAAAWTAGTYVIGVVASLAAAWWLWRRHAYRGGRFDRGLARRYIGFAAPLAVLAVFNIGAKQIDTVMVGFFWSAADVGHYFAAQRITSLVGVVPIAVGTLLFPMLSSALGRGDRTQAQALFRRALRLSSLVMAPVAAATVVFAPQILRTLVAAPFAAGASILAIFAIQQYLVAWTTAAGGTLKAAEMTRTLARAGITSSLVNISLNLVLIPGSLLGVPLLGLRGTGAAAATLVGQIVQTWIVVRAARRHLGPTGTASHWPRHILAAAAGGAAGWWAAGAWLNDAARIWDLAAGCLVVVVVYAAVAWLLRALRREDVRLFLDIAHPGRMARYALDEVRGDGRK